MNLAQAYQQALKHNGFDSDPAQVEAVALLQAVADSLCHQSEGTATVLGRLPLVGPLFTQPGPAQGAYLWGGVGRGKTFVMDVFFESLPLENKLRYHFHRMMYRVHNRLKELSGETDPIEIVAAELAEQARVICFDEFFVSDIGDAMILGKLLDGLFRRNVTLVATSNIPPDELYKGGLQRQQFLPAIGLIKEHSEIFNLDNGNDYRLRVLTQAEIWHVAPGSESTQENDQKLDGYFTAIAPEEGATAHAIEILGRKIMTRRRAADAVWFDFPELCDGPRSQNDYIEIARAFHTVLLSDVPELTREREDQARRFIALVDEFYDRKVKLIISAALPIDSIYSGSRLAMEFQRTASRLLEMQSTEYLAAPHLP
ncbi:MAG: cell division protein ZapE [Gammaproteobacteria bacterium]